MCQDDMTQGECKLQVLKNENKCYWLWLWS